MKYIKYFPFLFCFILCWSCGNENDIFPACEPEVTSSAYENIDVVTGIDFFDENGSPIGRWGFPNHYPGAIIAYPIPNTGTMFLSSQTKIKRVWLVPANCLKDSVTVDIPTLAQDLTYEISELESAQIKDIPTPDFMDNIALDCSAVAAGFYRLFCQLESEELRWYNVYIDPTVSNFPNFDFMEDGCI